MCVSALVWLDLLLLLCQVKFLHLVFLNVLQIYMFNVNTTRGKYNTSVNVADAVPLHVFFFFFFGRGAQTHRTVR